MSSGHQQHFTSTDMDMLNRILERAGIGDVPDPTCRQNRMDAARFLIETFQKGVIDEHALYLALFYRRGVLPVESTNSLKDQKINRPGIATIDGYRFGRRIEGNGTWTIYHVFSGEPAAYGGWNMAGLNVRTAERALKILNAPSRAA